MSNFTISGKKILVTGGAGFIGSNLCEALLNMGNRVVCLDNFSTGKISNIKNNLDHPNFTLVEGDIRNYEDCFRATKDIDFVLHQAALGSVPRSIKDPMTSNEVNITGFLNMLIASRDNNVNRFIFAASSSVYGDSKVLPKVEDIIGKPLSPYAITKIVNELYAEVFANTYGISTIGLRYFNVFGRRQDPDGAYAAVIPKFIRALMIGQSPIVNGDGNYSRDFTYIDNVIQANIISMKTENPRALNNVYNIAFGERITINELLINIKMFLSEYNKEILQVPIVYGETREGDIPHSHANIEKAKKILGYAPAFDLSLGLKETVNWYWKQM